MFSSYYASQASSPSLFLIILSVLGVEPVEDILIGLAGHLDLGLATAAGIIGLKATQARALANDFRILHALDLLIEEGNPGEVAGIAHVRQVLTLHRLEEGQPDILPTRID